MNSPNIMRSDDLKAGNRRRILNTLRKQGPLTRAEVGKLTGLSQAALSAQFSLLTEQGVVTSENKNLDVQKRGRPKTTVALDPTAASVVTIALMIDQMSFSLVDYAGNVLSRSDINIDTRSLDTTQLFDITVKGVNDIVRPLGINRLKAISIGFQGVTNSSTGELLWSPILTMDRVPIGAMLKDRFGVSVSVNNDCGLITKALHVQEKDKLGNRFGAVLFAHGIGLGLYLDGTPFTGPTSSAMELGHIRFEKNGALCRCGKHGCIEAYAADYGIQRTALDPSSLNIPTGPLTDEAFGQLVVAAKNNDQSAIDAFATAGKAIGFGLDTLYTLLEPLPIALIGHNADAVHMIRTEIENALTDAGRNPSDIAGLLHCFHDALQLLQKGLVLEGVSVVDELFADSAVDKTLETS